MRFLKYFLLSHLFTLAFLAMPSSSFSEQRADRPNVLLIVADDLRPELGCYGAVRASTPNLDRLASQGALFEQAYVQFAWCCPSRTSMMTGLRPSTTGVYDLVTHFRNTTPDVVTLPQHFKDQGYRTYALGKVYHKGLDDPRSWSVPSWVPEDFADPLKAYATEANIVMAQSNGGYASPIESAEVRDSELPDGQVTTKAVEIIRNHRGKQVPFFLCVGYYKPHMPFVAPSRYWDSRGDAKAGAKVGGSPPSGASTYSFLSRTELSNYQGVPNRNEVSQLDESLRKALVDGYLACVSFIDAQVGHLLDALENTGLGANTIIVFLSDNGWKLGEFGQWSKNSHFDVDTRVPMIMRGPGIEQGIKVESIVEVLDVYPTLSELARLPTMPDVEGTSFARLARGESQSHKGFAISHVIRNERCTYTTFDEATVIGHAIRTEDFRLVRWHSKEAPSKIADLELYRLAGPDSESINLADDKEFEAVLADLGERLEAITKDG